MLNLDTHVLLHALTGDLTRREAVQLDREPWSISGIVSWEIGKLAELGRIELDLDDPELTRTLAQVHVWPITLDICRAIRDPRLPGRSRGRDHRRDERRSPRAAADAGPPPPRVEAGAAGEVRAGRCPAAWAQTGE